MNERILNLLSLCLQAKEKGHDCFFKYSPHVQHVEIEVWIGGWERDKPRNFIFTIRFNGNIYDGELGVEFAETFLKGLIEA